MKTPNYSLDTKNLSKISKLIDWMQDPDMKGYEAANGFMVLPELVKVAKLENRIVLKNLLINGLMVTRMKKPYC